MGRWRTETIPGVGGKDSTVTTAKNPGIGDILSSLGAIRYNDWRTIVVVSLEVVDDFIGTEVESDTR